MRLNFFAWVQSKRRLIANENLIKTSGLMDENWYLQVYFNQGSVEGGAVRHYLLYGASEQKNPSPDFNTGFYLKEYPDARAGSINPLVHYIAHGKTEGRKPAPSNITFVTRPVTNAKSECIKDLSLARELAIFVTYAPKGKIKRQVRH